MVFDQPIFLAHYKLTTENDNRGPSFNTCLIVYCRKSYLICNQCEQINLLKDVVGFGLEDIEHIIILKSSWSMYTTVSLDNHV